MSEVYRAPYPFVRSTFTEWAPGADEDHEPIAYNVASWKPGVEWDERRGKRHSVWQDEPEPEPYAVADGVGEVIFTIVSRHKPGSQYPERVFYTRQWCDPDGKIFGNKKLHICSAQAFNRRKRGWFIDEPYELRAPANSTPHLPAEANGLREVQS